MKKILLLIVLFVGINTISKSQENTTSSTNEVALATSIETVNTGDNMVSQENNIIPTYPVELNKKNIPTKNKKQATKYIIIVACVVAAIVIYTLIANASIEKM